MYLATAYPNSALSALTLTVIALVMAASLALWLGLVFLADRQPRGRRQARAGQGGADAGAEPAAADTATADSEHGELDEAQTPGHHHGVAA